MDMAAIFAASPVFGLAEEATWAVLPDPACGGGAGIDGRSTTQPLQVDLPELKGSQPSKPMAASGRTRPLWPDVVL